MPFRNCWNWYAPRSFANESNQFVSSSAATYGPSSSGDSELMTYGWASRDTVSGAVAFIAVQLAGDAVGAELDGLGNGTITTRLGTGCAASAVIAVSFGEAAEA
eukprot:SAG31_NODE_32099_length_360_cov_0.727969_1_plen_103_part_10